MEEAVRARGAAREAVRDITPKRLRELVTALLEDSSPAPGVLTLLSVRAADGTDAAPDVEDRAAGVQLIYEGLRLTRSLARDEPWRSEPPHTESNLAILAADVMVSRGFSLLARTDAADKAVETVQAFGRDQTERKHRRDADAGALETDVFELAVIAGTTAAGADVPPGLREYAADLSKSMDGAPDAPESLPDDVTEALAKLSTRHRKTGRIEEVRSSPATDP